ncbi:MAG: TetR/AcrR family transcriptional regulator [Thermoanaerobaculia bacterium]|nr:TetR/AcrR family transcriptional regulator [Thermoanaerobaculia bacterium]
MTTTKGEETRRNILHSSLAMASRLGLDGLSIGTVAKQVGMSKSGLFAHFESKEDLQLKVLETGVDHFIRKVVTPALRQPRGEPRVRALFENWLTWSEYLPGGCPFIAAAAEVDDRPGPLREFLASSQKDWLGVLAQAARICMEEGHFRSDLEAEQFGYHLNGILLAHHHCERLLRDPEAEERARASFEELMAGARPA